MSRFGGAHAAFLEPPAEGLFSQMCRRPTASRTCQAARQASQVRALSYPCEVAANCNAHPGRRLNSEGRANSRPARVDDRRVPENVCRLSLRGMSPSIFDPYFLALERTPAVLRAWSAASRAFLPAREANSSIVPTTPCTGHFATSVGLGFSPALTRIWCHPPSANDCWIV